jgi:nitronate monooxygenase
MARYFEAAGRGDVDNTGVLVGEAVALIRDVRSAGAILRQMVQQAEALLARKAPSLLGAP